MAMLAFSPSTHTSYMPARPSPLSPRSANAFSVLPQSLFNPFAKTGAENESVTQNKPLPYSQRPVKATPFTNRNPDEQRERRRIMFLRRVEQTRDDKRWEGRSDHIQRSDYMTEQRRWNEQQSRTALQYETDFATSRPDPFLEDSTMADSQSDLFSLESFSTQPQDTTMEEAEEIAQQEQMELQALVDLAEQDPEDHEQLPDRSNTPNYDDDDYDSLFMEFIAADPDVDMTSG